MVNLDKPACATAARFDPATGLLHVDLSDGSSFSFVAREAQDLGDATDAQLAAVEVAGAGYGLHWPELDADFSVAGLKAGILGTRKFMAARAAPRAAPGADEEAR